MRTSTIHCFIYGCVILCVTSAGCSDPQVEPSSDDQQSIESHLASTLQSYKEQMDCVTPIVITSPLRCSFFPSGPVVSNADQLSQHSGKLYHLFTNDPDGYKRTIDNITEAPVGLILLKETHIAVELKERSSRVPEELESPNHYLLSASTNRTSDSNLVPGEIVELFFMAKIGSESLFATDNGWIYGEMDLDGNITTLTSTGTCKECHVNSPYDRVFGIPKPKTMYTGFKYSDDDDTKRDEKILEAVDKEFHKP